MKVLTYPAFLQTENPETIPDLIVLCSSEHLKNVLTIHDIKMAQNVGGLHSIKISGIEFVNSDYTGEIQKRRYL